MSERLQAIAAKTAEIETKFTMIQNRPNIYPGMSKMVAVDLESLSAEVYSFMEKFKDDFQKVCRHDWQGSCVEHIAQKCETCGKIILEGWR